MAGGGGGEVAVGASGGGVWELGIDPLVDLAANEGDAWTSPVPFRIDTVAPVLVGEPTPDRSPWPARRRRSWRAGRGSASSTKATAGSCQRSSRGGSRWVSIRIGGTDSKPIGTAERLAWLSPDPVSSARSPGAAALSEPVAIGADVLGPEEEPPAPEYDDAGVDLTLIREMLARTPAERLQALQSAVRSFEWLRGSARRPAEDPTPADPEG